MNLLYGLQAWGLQTFPLSRCAPGFSVPLRVEFHAPSSTHHAGDTLLLQLPTKQLGDYVMFSMAIVNASLCWWESQVWTHRDLPGSPDLGTSISIHLWCCLLASQCHFVVQSPEIELALPVSQGNYRRASV